MNADPYYWTQYNGAGGPVHFSTTYKQLDMLHHILNNCPEAVNQSDQRGAVAKEAREAIESEPACILRPADGFGAGRVTGTSVSVRH